MRFPFWKPHFTTLYFLLSTLLDPIRFFVGSQRFFHYSNDLTQRNIGMDSFHQVRHGVLGSLQCDAKFIECLTHAPVVARLANFVQA